MRVLCPGRIGIWKCWFFRREENRRTRRKTLRSKARTNNKLNPHMAPGRNRTRVTLVGGERSHHCAITAPPRIEVRTWIGPQCSTNAPLSPLFCGNFLLSLNAGNKDRHVAGTKLLHVPASFTCEQNIMHECVMFAQLFYTIKHLLSNNSGNHYTS